MPPSPRQGAAVTGPLRSPPCHFDRQRTCSKWEIFHRHCQDAKTNGYDVQLATLQTCKMTKKWTNLTCETYRMAHMTRICSEESADSSSRSISLILAPNSRNLCKGSPYVSQELAAVTSFASPIACGATLCEGEVKLALRQLYRR